MKKKTLKAWEKTNIDLDKYLDEPCEIDESLHLYIAETVVPNYSDTLFTQGGSPQKEKTGQGMFDFIYYYMTTSIVGDRYFYLGILPEFKQ